MSCDDTVPSIMTRASREPRSHGAILIIGNMPMSVYSSQFSLHVIEVDFKDKHTILSLKASIGETLGP